MFMKKKVSVSLVLMIAFLGTASAYAQTTPSAIQVFVDGAPVGQVNWRAESGLFVTDFAQFGAAGNYQINVGQSVLDPDPVFDYGFGVTNESNSAKSFRLAFDLPFDPTITLPTNVRATLGGTIVDTQGNGVSLSAPTTSGTVQTVTFNPGNAGTTINLGGSFSQAGVATGTQWDYGRFFAPGPDGNFFTPGPSGGPFSGMQVVTEFTLSARDSLSLDGYVAVKPIPEPETVVLIAAGLALLALNSKRRASARNLVNA